MVYIYICTTPSNFICLPHKTPLLYTYVHQLRVIRDLAVKPQTHLSPSPITMANSHRFDDVAHISIGVGIGNGHYTVCIISLISTSIACYGCTLANDQPQPLYIIMQSSSLRIFPWSWQNNNWFMVRNTVPMSGNISIYIEYDLY